MAEKQGLSSAVQDLVDPGQNPPDHMPGEQASLFPISMSGSQAGARDLDPSPRGVGRPPGAKNKNTEAWREFLLSRYPSPLQGLAEIYSRKLTDLAVELGFVAQGEDGKYYCTAKPADLLELLKVQIGAMEKLAPYVHSKMPIAVEAGENGLISLVINAGNNTQQNQGFKDIEFLDFNAEDFNASPQSSTDKGIENDRTTDN